MTQTRSLHDSPFDYQKQAKIIVQRHADPSSKADYERLTAAMIVVT
ncbi:MAG: hypothetical protein R3C28_10875 [Pirellulaceae bacterium]